MPASTTLLLIVYCLAIACFSLVGGLLPSRVQMTHTRTQTIMSLVSGLMLGVAFYHLLPHSVALFGGSATIDRAVWWLMAGLISMLLLLRLSHFHRHDFSDDDATHQHGAGNESHHHAHEAHAPDIHGLSWAGVALGLALHTLIDGLALGAVMHGTNAGGGLIGIGVFLAILLHKPLDSMSIVTLMESGGWSRGSRTAANVIFALICPLGALLFYFGVDVLGDGRGPVVAGSLAFAAGAFICIALSDLLPEIHFHSHDRLKLTAAFLLGIAAAFAMGSMEPAGLHVMEH